MKKLVTAMMIGMLVTAAQAEPEIKGTPSELTTYLSGIPKVVNISGESEVKVQADRAFVKLNVTTEGRSLQEALNKNAKLRQEVREELTKKGIPEDNISGSKFSSQPEYGFFSDKAKSYKIDNTIRVIIADESQFRVVAASIDEHKEVEYDGVEFEHSGEEELKERALKQACEAATRKRRLYEENLDVKLKPRSFTDEQVYKDLPMPMQKAAYNLASAQSIGVSAYTDAAPAPTTISQFGEIKYKAMVTIQYEIRSE